MLNFTELISFYGETLADFLMSEPIVYLFGAVVILFVLKITRSLLGIRL